MADTTFTNGVTLTDADWFNDVNRLHYTIFGDPATIAAARQTFIPTGGIIQAVEATPYATYASSAAIIPVDDTIPQITEGVQILTVDITPTSATNRLVIDALAFLSGDAARVFTMALFQVGTADALAVAADASAAVNNIMSVPIHHEMAAGATTTLTFTVRVGIATGTIYINGNSTTRLYGGKMACRLRIAEVKA